MGINLQFGSLFKSKQNSVPATTLNSTPKQPAQTTPEVDFGRTCKPDSFGRDHDASGGGVDNSG